MAVVKMKKEKKETASQLERRLKNAILHIDRTKDCIEIWFDDKGLRLIVDDNEGVAIVATNYHRHVFSSITASGISRPYLYIKRFVEIALANDCIVKDAKGNPTRSYAKLFNSLKEKEDKSEYNIAWYVDLWLFNIFNPLFSIGESEAESFFVFEQYAHNIARNEIILNEHLEDMTNHQFVKELQNKVKEYMKGQPDFVLFKAKSDDELMKEEMSAIQEQEMEQKMEEQADEGEK